MGELLTLVLSVSMVVALGAVTVFAVAYAMARKTWREEVEE